MKGIWIAALALFASPAPAGSGETPNLDQALQKKLAGGANTLLQATLKFSCSLPFGVSGDSESASFDLEGCRTSLRGPALHFLHCDALAGVGSNPGICWRDEKGSRRIQILLYGRKYLEADLSSPCMPRSIRRFDYQAEKTVLKLEELDHTGLTTRWINPEPQLSGKRLAISPKKHVIVGVVDTGIDYNHPALIRQTDRAEIGYDFINDDVYPFAEAYDPTGFSHGTLVSLIIARRSKKIAIVALRRNPERLPDEIAYLARRGARIIVFPFKIEKELAATQKAILDHPEILFVASAGNHPSLARDLDATPASFATIPAPNLILVASIDTPTSSEIATYSVYGKKSVHLAALGSRIEFISSEGKRSVVNGTSFASPQVAGACARMLTIRPALTPQELIAVLEGSVRKTPDLSQKLIWGGALDEEAAVNLVRKTRPWPVRLLGEFFR